jgi:hypothetical protein
MTSEQIKLQKKATALNAIMKLYNPLHKHGYTYYEGEGSFSEQRDYDVQRIVENLRDELIKLKQSN